MFKPNSSLFSSKKNHIMPLPSPLQFLAMNKTLNICLTSLHPSRFAIRSLPAHMLFNQKTKRPPLREEFSYSPCCLIGCAALKSNIYIVGGIQPDSFVKNPNVLHSNAYTEDISGKTVIAYNTTPDASFTTVPDMISPKTCPLVSAVGEERLYVLSDNTYTNIRPPVFEGYTLSTNSWEQLDPPPFLNPKTKYFETDRHSYASAVIGTSICVSTNKTSFKFDTEKKIWEPCMLFEGLHNPVVDNYHNSRLFSHDKTPCGPPFGFRGKAFLFEDDVLICMPYSKRSVVAYKIEGGKVVDSQCLRPQGLGSPPSTDDCIADFGNGLFCIVHAIHKCMYVPQSFLIVKPFFIKKKTGLEPGDFLHCEVINEFKYMEKDDEIWYPIGCFAQ